MKKIFLIVSIIAFNFNVFSQDIAPLGLDLDPRGPEEVEDVFELKELDSSAEGFHDIPFPGQMKTDTAI